MTEIENSKLANSIISKCEKSRRWSPQNGGVAQLHINYQTPSYDDGVNELIENSYQSESYVFYKEENILKAIELGVLELDCKIMKVTKVDYHIHPVKKKELEQRGRASKWEWVNAESKTQVLEIINGNKVLLK